MGKVHAFSTDAEFFSLLPLYGAMGLCWQLGGPSLAQSTSVGLVWVNFPLGLCLVCFSWMWWTSFVQTMNLPKLHVTISVVVYLMQEVSTCLVFSPYNSEGEGGKSGRECAARVSNIVCTGEGTTAWVTSLQMLQGCGVSSCSMLYCPLILVWNVRPSYCTSFMPFNSLIMVINENDVLHSVKEIEEWHFNPNICSALY